MSVTPPTSYASSTSSSNLPSVSSDGLHISDIPHTYKGDIISSSSKITTNLRTMHRAIYDVMNTIQNLPEPEIHYAQVKEQCLYLQREIIFLASQQEHMTKEEDKQYKAMVELLNRINIYVTGKDSDILNAHMKILTFITAILTPAGVLVGYFGMNFGDMGAPSNGNGVFSLKHGHFIVFVVLVAIVVFMTYLYFYVLS